MSKHSSSATLDSIARKRSSEEDESSAKKSKIDDAATLEDETNGTMEDGGQVEEPRSYIPAEELFLNLLDKIPKGSKKKTIVSLIKTLLKLKETILDEEDEEDPLVSMLMTKPTTSSDINNLQNAIILPGKPAGQVLPTASPITNDRDPNPLLSAFSPASIPSATASVSFSPAINNNGHADSTTISPIKLQLSALDACPPITPSLRQAQMASSTGASLPVGLTLPTIQAMPGALNAQELLRIQQHIRPNEKVKMIPPQTMSPLDVQIQQKERAFHQSALQQSMGATIVPQDPDVILCENLKQKILASIHSNYNGKASDEEIHRYLRQNFFMILENNHYTYVPNPWQHKPNFVRQFMVQAQQQQQQPQAGPSPMMLPPRPTPSQLPQSSHGLHSIPNLPTVLHPQMLGMMREGMIPPVSMPQPNHPVQLNHNSNWPSNSQPNILISSLQSNVLTAASGLQVIGSPKAGSRKLMTANGVFLGRPTL